MGRPYGTELSQLATTYAWARKADVAQLSDAISASSSLPLLVIGSGGSLSAAHHAAALHTLESGIASRAITPLEMVRSSIYLGDAGTLFLSAGGTNADILGSFRAVVEREPRSCTVLCFRPGSQLSRLAHEYSFVHVVEMTPPVAKDGFLSTNSLLAFLVLIERAYSAVFGKPDSLPASAKELLTDGFLDQLARECAPLWNRDTTLLLHGIDVSAAAIDFESKFSEAALGNVQVADLRKIGTSPKQL
jgi:fructoselysine-6-P-deglycase FrlB-like protein